METIKDLWASLVAYANERSTNPLTSAFVLTWAAWNYKFFVVLFNDETSAEKFAAIAALYPKPESLYGNALLFPLLTTLFYVFAYPYITMKVVSFYRKRQVEIANEVKEIEKERVRTVDEVNALVRRYEERLTAVQLEASTAGSEVNGLRNALTAAESELKELRKSATQLSEANRQIMHDNIIYRNSFYIEARKKADDFLIAFGLRKNLAAEPLLREIAPLSIDELKILFYLTDDVQREPTSMDIGNFLERNASEVTPLLIRLEERELVYLKLDSAKLTPKGRQTVDQMKEIANTGG